MKMILVVVRGTNFTAQTAMHVERGQSRNISIARISKPIITESSDMSQWIKCSEKMPVSDSDVLCFGSYGENPDGYEYIYMGWLDKKGRWRVSGGYQENRRAKATHWQPLPSPPEDSCAN